MMILCYRIVRFFKTALLLGAIVPALTHAEESYISRLEVEQPNELAALNLQPADSTLSIKIVNPLNNSALEMNFKSGESNCNLTPQRFFPEASEKLITTYPAPEINSNLCWFTLRRTERSWTAYINDQVVVRMPELWNGVVQITHPENLSPSDDDIDDYTQKLGSFTYEDNFLVPAGSAFPPTWESMSGSWKLHSVTGTVTGTGGYTLARQPKPEKSPNFYTLEGSGTNAVVLSGEPFYSHYEMRASIQHNSGTNGIVFLASERGGYLAFTARTDNESGHLTLDLWQQPSNPTAPRLYLESVQTELPAGQWLLLGVQLLDNFVICLADHIPVMRRRMQLPPGGRFGLFSNMSADEVTRFDDVVASTHEDILIATPGDVNFITRPESLRIDSLMRNDTCWAYLPPSSATNHWHYGTPGSIPLRQETLAVSTSETFTFGLTCGGASNASPLYSFACVQSPSNRLYTLAFVSTTNTVILDSYTSAFTSNRVHLALDALRPNELKGYADNQLVCFTRPAEQPGGIQGVFSSTPDDLFFTAPRVASKDTTMAERFEKNPLYVNDPFMRHWASPEGQWVAFEDGMTWFKGDITGPVQVRMPVVNNSVLHLCIPEGSSSGLCRVVVSNDMINVYTADSPTQAVITVKAADVPDVPYEKTAIKLFTIGVEDHLVWLGGDQILIAKTHLDQPMKGRRLRIEGMDLSNLKHTLVKRDHVFDTLFNESLYNWTINGGRWEVVNRFFCEPTWSHMNGESTDSLAALWSKYVFEGDFSIEFYAGMRMGWYTRPGDLNLTVMSQKNLTADGYTAIATGWDPDHSQLYSRLLRNGALMDITTKYLIPRTREGLARKGYQPLVAKGRDIHGAWYGMQLRRVGNNLQYIYDNEEVFNITDENPLQNGSLGIWTYRNSMMVARIKIAAESIKPRPFKFHSIPAGQPSSIPEPMLADSGVRINKRVVQPLAPDYWESYDTVSHPVVNFRKVKSGKPEMFVTSLLGAGSFLVKCNLPPASPDKMLGWRFEMARHPDAKVNFEFTTLTEDPKKGTLPKQGWTYILSGTTEKRGPRKIAGSSEEIPPSPTQSELIWTPVEIWIPSEVIRENLAVQIEGFGNLQPSEVQEGLKGNPPNAWYAIRAFREIHRGIPELTAPPEKRAQIVELAKVVNSLPPGELQMVTIPESLDHAQPVIEWAVPELANFGLLAQEDSTIPGSVVITPTHPWPSPMLPPKKVLADAEPAPFLTEGNNIRVLIPLNLLKPKHMTLTAELSDGRYFRQVVPMHMNETTNFPPTLLSFEMPEGSIKTFEDRPQDPALHKSNAAISFDHSDPARGGVLKISNDGLAYRLHGFLTKQIDLAATPVVQFKYKGDPMSIVSLSFGTTAFTFSETYNTHIRYSGAVPAVMDNRWHSWMGLPFDAMGSLPLRSRANVKPSYMLFASRSEADQSGLHSSLLIDDIATGPAVGPQRPFAFKADYIDQDGVATVNYAIILGDKPYDAREASELSTIQWLPAKNNEVMEPDLAQIPDGIHHLIVRAKDSRGAWSEPSDTPFILDRKEPVVTHAITATEAYNGSCLDLQITDPVSPPVINDLSFTCNGTQLDISQDNGFCNITHGTAHIQLDWIWSLRQILLDIPDGTELPLTISGITDAAGNRCQPYVIKIPIDKASDKRPPTIWGETTPANALIYKPTLTDIKEVLTTAPAAETEVALTPEGRVLQITPKEGAKTAPYLQHKFASPWDAEKHPFMALSLRMISNPGEKHPFKITFTNNSRNQKGSKESAVLSLIDPADQKYITGQVSDETNVWNDVIINVRDFLRSQSDDKKAFPVSHITLYTCPITPGSVGQLRSFLILSPWTEKNILTYYPYDLNGVTLRHWQGGYIENTFSPATIKPHTPGDNWMKIRFGDAAGNKTDMQMIPLPPALEN